MWLLVGAGLLVAVLVVFIGSARYLRRHLLAKLPPGLSVDIKGHTVNVTYSAYSDREHRTLYTIHAATEDEHRSGKLTLHDVSVVLYGRKGDRADRVYGDEFEYDKNAGIVRAIGVVHIDIGGAGSPAAGAAAAQHPHGAEDPEGSPRVLHALTRDLVYLEKLGVAATSEPIEFATGQMSGHAVGADYNTDTGMLLLHSAVHMAGTANGRPVHVTASAAQLEDRGLRAELTHARYESAGQAAQADRATIETHSDSTLERVQGEGNVRLEAHGATLDSDRADVRMRAGNRPQIAEFSGALRYVSDGALRQARGEGRQATITFAPDGTARHMVVSGAVSLVDRTRTALKTTNALWNMREVRGDRAEVDLAAGASGRAEVRDAVITGGARMISTENDPAKTKGTTELAGDVLRLHLVPGTGPNAPAHLDTVEATGRTTVRQLAADGLEQMTSADTLTARFRPASPHPEKAGTTQSGMTAGIDELASAVQQGHVHVVRRVPARPAGPGTPAVSEDVQDAVAETSSYDGDRNRLTLTGAVQLSDAAGVLWADRVGLDRLTGNAQAEGGVRGSFNQASSPPKTSDPKPSAAAHSDPVHVAADRAELNHAADLATFFGTPVRMWQGSSQVQAAVVQVAPKTRELRAHATPGNAGGVDSILIGATAGDKPGRPAAAQSRAHAANGQQSVRVHSRDLSYSDTAHTVVFGGGVRIDSGAEAIRSETATAYLAGPAATEANTAADTGISLDGRVERVVATGAVRVEQPGRRATGEQVVYTAPDQLIVLTGTSAAPPRVTDTAQGTTVTAVAFRFHTGDESVEALSIVPGQAAGTPVRTEAPVRR